MDMSALEYVMKVNVQFRTQMYTYVYIRIHKLL